MADCNYPMEGWEWESLFTSSLLEPDNSWHYDLSEPGPMMLGATDLRTTIQPSPGSSLPSLGSQGIVANPELSPTPRHETDSDSNPFVSNAVIATNMSDGSLDSSGNNPNTPVSSHHISSETSLVNPPTRSITKKKKRDPRLECPNFLAGRIPCSCPEEDEFEEDAEVEALVKKRSKVAARCQVPSCGNDISHLKGYHQRHRVCLACANSPKVMLKEQAHRYCQQCGKFHRLSDFDEGKRSCRRKLERHNKRRRRRPADEEEEAEDGGVPFLGNETDGSKINCPREAPQSAQTTTSSRQGLRTQTARAQLRKQGARSKEERKAEGASIHQSSDSCLVDFLQNQDASVGGVTPELLNPNRNDDSSDCAPRFGKEVISSNKSEDLDEHLLLDMLIGDSNKRMEQATENVELLHALKSEAPKRGSHASGTQKKRIEYVTPCPTGRVSFKLYDWNPADFPRRLRQQIFEWLANMPVELESYVRSGCIILTFFATMPHVMWDKVSTHWMEQVQTFILNSGAEGTKLLGTGQLMTQMVKKSICLRKGKVTSAYCKDRLAPVLVDLYPCSLEAGCYTHIYVSGFNFSGARFLVSFGEQYVECTDCESAENHHSSNRTKWDSLGNLEVRKVTVFLPPSQKFGLAYVEVESVHGVSNFLPILVADKDVCSEMNAVSLSCVLSVPVNHTCVSSNEGVGVSRSQYLIDILTDLGWSLKYMNKGHVVDKVAVMDALMHRLQCLLSFSSEHCCHAVTQRLIQTALNTVIAQKIHCISAGPEAHNTWNLSNTSKDVKDILTSGMLNLGPEEGYCTSNFFAVLPKVDSCHADDRPSQAKGLPASEIATRHSRVLLSTSVQLEELDSSIYLACKALPTAMEVPLLEERIPDLEDGWRQRGCWSPSLSWPRRAMEPTGTSSLCVSNRKFYRILVAAVGIVTVCTGMCFMLQHPHEVVEISMSLRRCLWGSSTGGQHV